VESPLLVVFLAVIALTALVQAGMVAALAIGLRAGNQRLAEMEARFEHLVAPQIRSAALLTTKMADLSEKSLAHAKRMDTVVADASRSAEKYLDDASVRLEGAVERAAVRVDTEMAVRGERFREHRIVRKLSSASAFVAGLQRALEVWQATAASAADEDGDEDEEGLYEDEEDDFTPEGGPPADPSPS
jgi:hypothetical protein